MAWDSGIITSATCWAALSQKVKDLISGGSGIGNWSFMQNLPAGTGLGQSGSASYSLDVFRCRGAASLYKRIVTFNICNSTSSTATTSFVHPIVYGTGAYTPGNKFFTLFIVTTKTAGTPDDPTSVTMDGTNPITFTKIKSQAGGIGGTGDVKGTLWIGKSSTAPTGTNLTVSFGANTQTGCLAMMDQWDGVDLGLGADGVDSSGNTKIGIQVVGNNGTTQLSHQATLATFLDPLKSVAITWSTQTASASAYTAETGWITTVAADITKTTPTTRARAQWRPNAEDTSGILTSAGVITSWCTIAFEFQRLLETGTLANANDAGKDWFFMIEIPVPDGSVTSVINCAEDFDRGDTFRAMPPTPSSTPVPFLPGYWRNPDWNLYTSVFGNNRVNLVHQALAAAGFSYWIKITSNGITISTRIGSFEASNTCTLFDSFVTNAPEMPLLATCGPQSTQIATSSSFSRIPGVVSSGAVGTMWQCGLYPWTTPTASGITTNAAGQQDLFSSQKIHVARVFVFHTAGQTIAQVSLQGYARGLLKTDYLCFATGGAVQLGDTMTIAGNTWTVIGRFLVASSLAMVLVTRAT